MSTAAFPKILHIGDKQIHDLFDGEVEITEKVDGSQFGFGKENGRLFCRSKGKEQDIDNPDMMFIKGVEYVKTIADRIPDNHTFYGEYLQKPKHNTLAYDRIPKNHIALFGAYNQETKEFYNSDTIKKYADLFEVDQIPVLHVGGFTPEKVLDMVKERVSYLGGQNIEGVVVKAYKPWLFLNQIPLNVMSGKYVTEEFKEVHNKNWKAENTGKGKLEVAISQYRSEARWNKAIQHLRDDNLLTDSPKDIGELIKEVRKDIVEEEKEAIKDTLWKIYSNDFLGAATAGLPQWYKEKLVKGESYEE
jgi:RNA ligase